MTRYHGGKIRIGNHIAKAIIKYIKEYKDNYIIDGYCEPFCGMCGVYRYIVKYTCYNNYLAYDINSGVINFWNSLKNGWKPPENISEKDFNNLKQTRNEMTSEHMFVGHLCSFGGHYFGSFTENYNTTHSRRKCINDALLLKNVSFKVNEYNNITNLKNFIIYCDPPYKKNHKYKVKFDNDSFWKWCQDMAKDNIVIVSEQSCPIKHKLLLETKHLGARYNKNRTNND